MVLIFLRDWRSALIVVLNIPFALLSAVILLWATGQTINIMTLGGLALAVGVLVDEATVEIENIHTQMLPGVSRARAVVEACSRTAMARLLSMFCILAVFVPSFFMIGVGRQLFVPLSLAVAFSMIASYLLSSSLVPVFSTWLMREAHRGEEREGFFGLLRWFYDRYLGGVLRFRWPLALVYLAGAAGLLYVLLPRMGTEIVSRRQRPAAAHPPARARRHAHRRDRAHRAARARRHRARGRPGQRRDHQRFRGPHPLQLSRGPDPSLHQRAAGSHHPGRAEARTPRAARRCANGCAQSLRTRAARTAQVSFEAGDIVTQVMSFGSPTPGRGRRAGRQPAGRLRLRAEGAGADWPSSTSCAICSSRRR